jgi:hypothetical protein
MRPRNHRGGRDNDRRGGRGGGGGRRRDHRGGGGYRGRGGNRGHHGFHGRNGSNGNERERIAVESGFLVLIDQFMLANQQFAEEVGKLLDAAPEAKDAVINKFGGRVVELTPGTYKIDRDPYACSIIIHQDDETPDVEELKGRKDKDFGSVFVDTRCLAMIDRELLDDSALLEKYQSLWFSNQEKACRDLLRDNGGAVRYGFNRLGDELVVMGDSENDQVLLLAEKPAFVEEAAPEVAAETTEEVAPAVEA